MSDLKQAAQQALDVLRTLPAPAWTPHTAESIYSAITTLEAALAASSNIEAVSSPDGQAQKMDVQPPEPIGTAGDLFTYAALARFDLRPSTKVYITHPPEPQPEPQPEPVAWRPSWCRDVLQSGCGWFFGAPTKADIEYQRKHGSKIDYAYAHLAPADPPQRQPEPVAAMGKRLIMVDETFDALMYWLERCEDKGHLENCADLIEPWNNFQYTESPQRQPLSDEQIDALELPESGTGTIRDLVRVIEKAHGIGGDK